MNPALRPTCLVSSAPAGLTRANLNRLGVWRSIRACRVGHFRPEGSSHRPQTWARLCFDGEGLYGLFVVRDRYVRCVHRGYQSCVWKDSCVEFFVRPLRSNGYFNFEFDCGGSLLCSFIRDWTRTEGGFRDRVFLDLPLLRKVKVYHSMRRRIEPEIARAVTWRLAFFIPFSVLHAYVGSLSIAAGSKWRANFNKCGDETSHPHWASWSPLRRRNFHEPDCFGTLTFGTCRRRKALP